MALSINKQAVQLARKTNCWRWMLSCRHKAHKGRQRAAARDADPEPHSSHDSAHSSRTGRHNGVRFPYVQLLPCWDQQASLHIAHMSALHGSDFRDGTTSTVLLIGELMKQAERYLNEGTHPRVIVEVPALPCCHRLVGQCRACSVPAGLPVQQAAVEQEVRGFFGLSAHLPKTKGQQRQQKLSCVQHS